MAWPQMPAAVPPRDQKYRFNWSAPIVVSRFNPAVIYHGGNLLLRSDNRGKTWREISPDLTRNDKSKQGPGGAPITNEGAGGETYGVIDDIAESPHDAGTIWVGTDDGLVQLTRDGGKTWSNVTPPDVGEAMVERDRGVTARTAGRPTSRSRGTSSTTSARWSSRRPTTASHGRESSRASRPKPGLESCARIPSARDLLYLGTETGFYVSFNGGQRWTRLQLNLPVTPITDLRVHANDLIASTAGRSFWILDDLSPLQQWTEATPVAEVRLFKPRPAYRTRAFSGGFGGANPRAGRNAPNGATIDFWLAKVPEGDVSVDILDSSGTCDSPVHDAQAGHRRAALRWMLRPAP